MKAFEKATYDDIKEVGQQVAKEGAKRLQGNSPKKGGIYAKGWGVTPKLGTKKASFTIHNKKKPGLSHLLEKGHALSNGGRSKAIVHIQPVEEWCNTEFEKRLIRRIQE